MSGVICIGCINLEKRPYRCKKGNKLHTGNAAHGGRVPYPENEKCFESK